MPLRVCRQWNKSPPFNTCTACLKGCFVGKMVRPVATNMAWAALAEPERVQQG
jgi:hypothetical protein